MCSGSWKPKAMRWRTRSFAFVDSIRAFDRSCINAASMVSWWRRIFLPSSTKADARARCPGKPCVEHGERRDAFGGDDGPQLLFQQVGPVEGGILLSDPRELLLLAGGQVLGVLPQGEPAALELFRIRPHALSPCLVPDLPSHFVQGV